MLSQYDWVEVFLTDEVRMAALAIRATYAVDSQDAVHLASAQLDRVEHFASLDRRFRKVDGLHLWNDLVHATQPV